MIHDHLPILQVVIPLLAAPICILLRRERLVWAFSLIVSWITFIISVAILSRVLTIDEWVYPIGGWAAPWGIEYRVDALNAFILLIVSCTAAIVLAYAPRTVAHEIPTHKHYLFYAVFLLCLTGLLGIAITGDVFNVFVFLEISALSSYVLIGMGDSRRALTSSYRYLVLGTIGSTFLLIGIGLMYMLTGTLNMADLSKLLAQIEHSRTLLAAFAFLTVGASIKMALFPLHTWLPNAYTYAPSMVSAFIASTSTKVSFYFFLRIIFSIFGVSFAYRDMHLDVILMPLALITIFVASATAIYQTNIKRLLAYSSVAQIGYMVLGLSFANVNGLTGSVVHLFNHALMKGGLFLAVGCIYYRIGSVELRDVRGLAQRMPLTMGAFVIGGLGLIGVPMTAGFTSKWHLILGALDAGHGLVAFLTLLSSLLAVIYVWKVVEAAYFKEPDGETNPSRCEAPLSMLIPTWIMIGATLLFGIYTRLPVGTARQAATWLLGVDG